MMMCISWMKLDHTNTFSANFHYFLSSLRYGKYFIIPIGNNANQPILLIRICRMQELTKNNESWQKNFQYGLVSSKSCTFWNFITVLIFLYQFLLEQTLDWFRRLLIVWLRKLHMRLSISPTIPAKLQTCRNCRRYRKPRFPASAGIGVDIERLDIRQFRSSLHLPTPLPCTRIHDRVPLASTKLI